MDSESEWEQFDEAALDGGDAGDDSFYEESEVSEEESDFMDEESDFEEKPKKKKAPAKKKAAPKKKASPKKKAAPKKKASPKKKAAPKKTVSSSDDGDKEGDGEGEGEEENKKVENKTASKRKASTEPSKRKTSTDSSKRKASGGSSVRKTSTKKTKVEELKGDAARSAILDYLVAQNRPYSYLQVFENLHKVVKKTSVTKILDKLVTEEELSMHQFNKTKLYVANQEKLPPLDEEGLKAMDEEVEEKRKLIISLKQEVNNLNSECSALESQPTNVEADERIAVLEKETAEMQAKLTRLGGEVTLISAEEMKKNRASAAECLKHWRVRKRAAMDMVDAAIGESAKKPTQFLRDLGCDLDADFIEYNVVKQKMGI